jgi:hypothetical protein
MHQDELLRPEDGRNTWIATHTFALLKLSSRNSCQSDSRLRSTSVFTCFLLGGQVGGGQGAGRRRDNHLREERGE